jgi:hypothetical protein
LDFRIVQRETISVFEYLADEFQKQLGYADRELGQTQILLQDAIETLTESFCRIHVGVEAIADRVRETAQQSGDESVQELSAQLENDINTAIRSLQFQDMTRQLVDHAIHRISAMNHALADIKTMSEERHEDWPSFIDYLYRHKESILMKVASLDERKTNPVSQGHMGSGDIDLF